MKPHDAARWQRLDELFAAALALPAGERGDFLDRACADDPELRAEVESLLASDRDDAFLRSSAAVEAARAVVASGRDSLVGRRLGPYEIVAPLAAGGMGEVYRARDSRLGRSVAIKVMPPHLAADPEARRRFDREARAISALAHPHICALHDVGSDGGVDYLVMELIEGETLAARLERGPVPLAEALRWAAQIADALERAHRAGIVHRDLKPGNVMLTRQGIKLLDFGLARQTAPVGEASRSRGMTRPAPLTAEGTILGTMHYMAPEQLEGRPADHRADLFAMGAMLYEMVTGVRAFEGETPASVISAVLRDSPAPVSTRVPVAPPALDLLVESCLAKDPEERWQSAHDLKLQLQGIAMAAPASAPAGRGSRRLAWAVAAAAVAVAVALAVVLLRNSGEAAAPVLTFRQLTFDAGEETQPSLAPDGKTFVFVKDVRGNRDLFLQRVDGRNAINLTPDSDADEGAPTFSPDGNLIAFRSERDGGGIFVMGATGESVRRLSDRGHDPAWSPDGTQIVYCLQPTRDPSLTFGLANFEVVDLRSGEIRTLLESENTLQPRWSPRGDRIAFWVNSDLGQRDIQTIAASGDPATIRSVTDDLALDWSPTWSADGRSLYFASDRDGTMNVWRVPIDPRTGGRAGEPEQLRMPAAYAGFLSAAGDALVFESQRDEGEILVARLDPATELLAPAARPALRGSTPVRLLAVSPDGRSVAFTTRSAQEDVFVVAADGSGVRQVTDDAYRDKSVSWWPDGSRMVFFTNRAGGAFHAWSIRPDGSGATRLTADPYPIAPLVSRDGRRLAALWTPPGVEPRTRVVPLGEAPAGGVEDLPPTGGGQFFPAAWSPGDQRLAGVDFLERTALYVYTFATGRMETLPVAALAAAFLDDDRLVYVDGHGEVGIADVTTGASRRVGTLTGAATPSCRVSAAAISLDGRTLAVYCARRESDIWWMGMR